MADKDRRDKFNRRLSALKAERSTFDEQYQSLAEFVSPRRGRFLQGERNRGGRHYWNKIINGEATLALGAATAGMFNGVMSPSRPWFMLETDDPDLAEHGPSKEWFYTVQEQMRRIFNDSNLYNMAPMMLREQLLFGTGCMSHEDDAETLCRFYAHTVGSYYIAQSDRFVIDTVYRETELTVAQIVQRFSRAGEVSKNISATVRNQYDLGNYDAWYPIIQVVEPNPDARLGSLRKKERPFVSVYYEQGNNDRDAVLSESGFYEFPFYCPRWETTNEDVYGTNCPGMAALGDVRQLQLQEKRKAQGIDKMVNPPLHGPSVLRNQPVSSIQGGGTFYDPPGTNHVLKPVYEVRLDLQALAADMDRVEGRIKRAFFVDLFLAISAMEGVQPRNQLELMQRNQERLLQLGPVLERQFGEFLNPLIDRTFNQMLRAGIVPPPPAALQGRRLKPRYVSTLAMAQQAAAVGTIERMAAFVSSLAQAGFPGAMDKFNAEQAVDVYADATGTPPQLVVPDEVVAERRAQQEQQQAAITNLAAGQQMADMAKKVGEIDLGGDTVAGRMVRSAQGGAR